MNKFEQLSAAVARGEPISAKDAALLLEFVEAKVHLVRANQGSPGYTEAFEGLRKAWNRLLIEPIPEVAPAGKLSGAFNRLKRALAARTAPNQPSPQAPAQPDACCWREDHEGSWSGACRPWHLFGAAPSAWRPVTTVCQCGKPILELPCNHLVNSGL